jgi:NADP-dependent 3-hydroxy acid dehydrogenase YdfG
MRLDGKKAVISGASSGIGAATAEALAEAGAALFLGARRQDKLEAVAREIRARVAGAKVELHRLDVTDQASAEAFARAAGSADILVNNAGLARGLEPIATGDVAGFQETLDTNVMGVLRLTRLFLPDMLRRGTGHVVFLGSVAGMDPYAGGAVYCASKAAVTMIARTLRHEVFGTGLRVSVVDPGLVAGTEFSVVRFRGDVERAAKPYQNTQPLTPRDVAECIAFAATRPPHVNVEDILVLATAQVGATKVSRQENKVP